MRDLWRLILLALTSFALVGGAMSYSRGSDFRQTLIEISDHGRALARNTVTAFSGTTGPGLDQTQTSSIDTPLVTLRVPRPKFGEWVGLMGFPDETEVMFAVPPLDSYTSGQLDLVLDSQLAHDGDGVLQISVNGTLRQAIVLDSAQQTINVSVPLSNEDLQRPVVALGLAAHGTTSSGQTCPTEAGNSGSVISLEPQSALAVTTSEAINDPRTAIVAAASPLALSLSDVSQPMAIWAAQRLRRAGIATDLVADGHDATRLIASAASSMPLELRDAGDVAMSGASGVDAVVALRRSDRVAPAALASWPLSVQQLATDTKVRNFRGTKRWTIPYALADLPQGRVPDRLAIDIRASTLAAGNDWLLRVSLDGNLLQTQRFAGSTSDISLVVDLPIALQHLANALTVELVDTSPGEGACNRKPDAQAQLLTSSRLETGVQQPAAGWGAMVQKLAAGSINLGMTGAMTPAQASALADLLGTFLPADAVMTYQAGEGDFSLILTTGAQYAAALRLAGSVGGIQADALILSKDGQNGDPLFVQLDGSEASRTRPDIAESDVLIVVRYNGEQ